LDFEANCTNQGSLKCQEVIEFPIVPVCLKTNKILQDKIFHEYVKPTEVPEITEFCTGLTGITQETVNKGSTIQEVLQKCDAYMLKNGFNNENTVFVTCGNWDLNTCLKNEMTYKNIQYSEYFKKFVNIKMMYESVTGQKAKGMDGMLQDLNLELDGKHHSGIDDSKNIAKILVELLKKARVTNLLVKNVI